MLLRTNSPLVCSERNTVPFQSCPGTRSTWFAAFNHAAFYAAAALEGQNYAGWAEAGILIGVRAEDFGGVLGDGAATIINGGQFVSTADVHDCSFLHDPQYVVLGFMG